MKASLFVVLLVTSLAPACIPQAAAPTQTPVAAAPSQPAPAPQPANESTDAPTPPTEHAELLSKDLIRRTIRRSLPAIRHCYERALLAEPGLRGTVMSEFSIASDGRVAKAEVTGMKSEVTECVRKVVASLIFAKPSGGGDVKIKYPFVFVPAGQQPPGYRASEGHSIASIWGLGLPKGGALAKPPSVQPGDITADEGLDKNIVRRYFRRKLPRIRHCYERELLLLPQLRGKVVVEFTIGVDGSVAQVEVDGINKKVSDCITTAVRTILFPKPKGGAIVKVRYPLTFVPAGG